MTNKRGQHRKDLRAYLRKLFPKRFDLLDLTCGRCDEDDVVANIV